MKPRYLSTMHWITTLLRDLWRLFFPDPDYERRHREELDELRKADKKERLG